MEELIQRVQAKKCQNCGSYFVGDRGCEACGFQFWVDKLGGPFGERSLYTLKENYWNGQSLGVRLFPKYENKRGRKAIWYRKSLIRRFQTLLDFFLSDRHVSDEQKKFFFIEFKDLVFELLDFGVNQEFFINSFETRAKNSKALAYEQQVMSWVSSNELN